MTLLDPSTLDSPNPRTRDGRRYPEYLRAYEQYDPVLLPVLAETEPATFDQIGDAVGEAKARSVLPHWLSSAEWRGLVERRDPAKHLPRTYVLGQRARSGARP